MKPLLIRLKALGTSIRGALSADHDGGAAEHNDAAVSSVVAYTCGWFVADKDSSRTLDNAVGRSYTCGHIAQACCRHKADEHSWAAGRQNRPADMWNGRNTWRYHRACVHITYSCCWRHLRFSVYLLFLANQSNQRHTQMASTFFRIFYCYIHLTTLPTHIRYRRRLYRKITVSVVCTPRPEHLRVWIDR